MTNPFVGHPRPGDVHRPCRRRPSLFSVLGTIGFVEIAHSGRDAIHDRIEAVLDELEARRARRQRHRPNSHRRRGARRRRRRRQLDHPPARARSRHAAGSPSSGTAVLLVGRSSQARLTDSLRSLFRGLWIAIPLASMVAALLAGLATRRALRPVEPPSPRLADTTGGGPAGRARVPVPDTGDEVEHLRASPSTTCSSASSAVDSSSGGSPRDAAHELRTPLMALQGELELVGGRATQIDDATLDRLRGTRPSAWRPDRRPRPAVDARRGAPTGASADVVAPAGDRRGGGDGTCGRGSGVDLAVPLDPRSWPERCATSWPTAIATPRSGWPRASSSNRASTAIGCGCTSTTTAQASIRHTSPTSSSASPASTRPAAPTSVAPGSALAIVASVAAAHDGVAAGVGPLGGARVSLWLPTVLPAGVS